MDSWRLDGQFLATIVLRMSFASTPVELKDFHKHEGQYGPPRRLTKTLRLSIPLVAHIEGTAAAERSDASTLIRHALHEYFEKRGKNAFVAP